MSAECPDSTNCNECGNTVKKRQRTRLNTLDLTVDVKKRKRQESEGGFTHTSSYVITISAVGSSIVMGSRNMRNN